MSLSDYRPATHPLVVGGQALATLRGLNTQDLTTLIHTHIDDLEALGELAHLGRPLNDEEWQALLMAGLSQFPGLVANAIALAADEPHSAPTVMKMPMAVQLEALHAITQLTFTEGISVKKFQELVVALLANVKKMKATKP